MTTQEQIHKKRSRRYAELIQGLTQDIQKLKPRIDAIFEEGRKCGLTDMEIGKDVRFRMKPYYSRQCIWENLPPTARMISKARPNRRLGKLSLPNEPRDVPGRWNISPEEYDLKHLNEYDNDLLIKIVKFLDKNNDGLMSKYMHWDGIQEKLNKENKELKDENIALKKRIAELEKEAAKK